MIKKFCSVLLLLAALLLPQVTWAGITYEGSTTIGENIMPEAAKAFEAKTGIKFDSIGGLGSGKGFKIMIEGKADIAGLSRNLSDDEKKESLFYQIIGYDAVAVFVNDKNPIKNLSKQQLKDIFTGKITNWQEVGGNDAKIVVVSEIKAGERATIKEFKDVALDKEALGDTKEIDKPHDCVIYAATDADAITFASLAFAEPGARAIALNDIEPSIDNVRSGAYLLSRPLVLASKENPKEDIKKFFDFVVSLEGQKIVQRHFVTI